MKAALALGLGLVLAVGSLALRLPQLDRRPMHTDESVHAFKFLQLWEEGDYRYDPHEYHGPSLYYATLPLVWMSGAATRGELSESLIRLTPVCFGMLLVVLVLLAWREMGLAAAFWAAGFTALSPAMVFYSRYFIHEMMLVVFSFGFLWCLWRCTQHPGRGWMAGVGLCLGLMQATKETYVLCAGAAGVALLATRGWSHLRCEVPSRRKFAWRDSLWGIAAFLLVSVTLFTSFFQNWEGPVDAWRTYGIWITRAEGQSPHVHPWWYYWELLLFTRRGSGPIWSEAILFGLGLVGMAAALGRHRQGSVDPGWGRFLTFYTLALSAAYTVIRYKTPWCVLGFWHGWILLAGLGTARLVRAVRWGTLRWIAAGLLLCGAAQLGAQAYRAAFPYADSQRNPHVYAHTLPSLLDLVEMVKAVAASSPAGTNTVIKVMAEHGDYWPLPWYLREFRTTGWYGGVPAEPRDAAAPIVIASPQYEASLRAALGERQRALGLFGLRPGVFLQLHVDADLWDRYIETKSR
jgi:uncharacterized protein (TIGR03663 family)